MRKKKEKSDDSEVAFIASAAADGTEYILKVSCKDGLDDKEFADSLVAFANDIYNGQVTFQQVEENLGPGIN